MKFNIDKEKDYTVYELAEALNVSNPAIIKAINNKRVKATKVMGRWWIKGADVFGTLITYNT